MTANKVARKKPAMLPHPAAVLICGFNGGRHTNRIAKSHYRITIIVVFALAC
jgi:hypothetical protein